MTPLMVAATLGESAFEIERGARKVLVTPDGTRVISIGNGAQIWDLETGARIPDGTQIYVGTKSGRLIVFKR